MYMFSMFRESERERQVNNVELSEMTTEGEGERERERLIMLNSSEMTTERGRES